MIRALAVACLAACSLLPAVPAAAAVAPGRVAFSVATHVPRSNVDAGGAGSAVALPDGGAVMLAFDGSTGLTAVQLRPDGSLDPSFGSRGIARIAVPVSSSGTQQLLRRPDGRLLAIGTRAPATRFGSPRFTIVGLTANGALDPSFGNRGVAELELAASCGGDCGAAALAPDGSIVITGSVGEGSGPGSGNFRWIVIRLTPAGALDPSFGIPVIDGPANQSTGGSATVVRPSGQVVVLGTHAGVTQLAGLTANGAPDPSFHGGAPLTVPDRGYRMVLHDSGAIDVAGDGHLQRFTPAGWPDPAFGNGGAVAFGGFSPSYGPPAMLAAPDGGTLLYGQTIFEPTVAGLPRLHVLRITPAGGLGAAVGLAPAFGGGLSSPLSHTTGSIKQNSFRGALVARPNGSYLAVGGLSVVHYTGEGEGRSAGFVAVAGYTPLLTPDPAFGGRARATVARVSVARQHARSDVHLRRVLVRVKTSGPGLLLLRVRDGHRRILAQQVAPVYAAGRTTVRIPLTATGRRILRRGSLRVLVGHDFRDVLTGRDHGVVRTRLR